MPPSLKVTIAVVALMASGFSLNGVERGPPTVNQTAFENGTTTLIRKPAQFVQKSDLLPPRKS